MRKGNDPSEATPGRLQKLYQPVCKSVRTLRLAWHAGARALTLRLPPARQLPPALRLPQALPLPPPRDQHSRVLMRCRLLPSALRPTGRKRPPIPQPKCRRNPPLHQPSARMMRVWPTRGHGKDLSLTRRALWSVQGPKQQGRAWVPRAASSIPPPSCRSHPRAASAMPASLRGGKDPRAGRYEREIGSWKWLKNHRRGMLQMQRRPP